MSATTKAKAASTGSSNGRVQHLTLGERAALGKATRVEVPRRVHASSEAAPGRRDPVEVRGEQALRRVPELVPIRYSRLGRPTPRAQTYRQGGRMLSCPDSGTMASEDPCVEGGHSG